MTTTVKPPADLASLTRAGTRTLKDVARGRGSRSLPDRKIAISLLADSAIRDRHHQLDAILGDTDESPQLRYYAATALARTGTETARALLATRLRATRNETVLSGILQSLGRIGGQPALTAVQRVANRRRVSSALKTQAMFAAALIKHRLGLTGPTLPKQDRRTLLSLEPAGSRSFTFSEMSETDGEAVLSKISGTRFDIDYLVHPMYRIECGPRTWVLVLNSAFHGPETGRTLTRTNALPAVLLRQITHLDRYNVAQLIFTAPTGREGLHIYTHRPSGVRIAAGSGKVIGEDIQFNLAALERPGAAAMDVRGRLGPDGATLDRSLSAVRLQPKRRPSREIVHPD